MSTVMINCPKIRLPVSTGIETEAPVFRCLPRISAELVCPACGDTHVWTCDDAWLAGEERPAQTESAPAA